ncbi:hypothetical protein [Mesorhizobium sp. M0965]|uniref:hypothetical protein n=1 Tax=unclassified Mesorhizobium TaxID=325217 RepID=UPI0033382D4A
MTYSFHPRLVSAEGFLNFAEDTPLFSGASPLAPAPGNMTLKIRANLTDRAEEEISKFRDAFRSLSEANKRTAKPGVFSGSANVTSNLHSVAGEAC